MEIRKSPTTRLVPVATKTELRQLKVTAKYVIDFWFEGYTCDNHVGQRYDAELALKDMLDELGHQLGDNLVDLRFMAVRA